MRIYTGYEESRGSLAGGVVAIGNFDGVHVGHQVILQKAKQEALARGIKCGVFTFEPHPLHVLFPTQQLPLIVSIEQKKRLFEEQGIDVCIFQRFDSDFAALSPQVFVERVLHDGLGVAAVVIGDNFTFGAQGKGTVIRLKEMCLPLGINVFNVPPVVHDKEVISSSSIRRLVKNGEVQHVSGLLGRAFALTGSVIKGEGRGRQIGVPTANLKPEQTLLLATGVYHTRVTLADGRVFQGATNVGYRPTFHAHDQLHIETHLIGFLDEIYGQRLQIEFLSRLREERKFENLHALFVQIQKDITQIKER